MMSIDLDLIELFKQRLIDRYTAAEIVDLLNVSVEDVIEQFENRILGSELLIDEVGMSAAIQEEVGMPNTEDDE